MPLSHNQMELAKLLEKELQELGLKDIKRRESTITIALYQQTLQILLK